jgi:hypothetical protein
MTERRQVHRPILYGEREGDNRFGVSAFQARRDGPISGRCAPSTVTKGQQAIRELTRAMFDRTGNLPPLPGIFPDYAAPIVRNTVDGRELAMVRWACRRRSSP